MGSPKNKTKTGSRLQGRLRLRPMLKTDLPMVYQLERQCQAYPWPIWFFRRQLNTASCWVLVQDSRIIGFGIFRRARSWAHIMNMCVAPDFRLQGLGRRIMLHLLELARRQYATRAWLEVHITNEAAILLYQKLGFRKKMIRKRYYTTRRGRENALVMVRKLSPPYLMKSAPGIGDNRIRKDMFFQ